MTKAVAKKKTTEVATSGAAPDFMKGHEGRGSENIGAKDVEVPRITLLQSLSPEVTDGDQKPGEFYHSIAEITLGKELKIIPVFVSKRYLLWKPRHEGGGILARADDGVHWSPPDAEFTVKPIKGSQDVAIWKTAPTVKESGLAEWGSSLPKDPDSQPAATEMYVYVCVLPDHPELSPCVVTLQRGALIQARKFNGKIKAREKTIPAYGQVYSMSTNMDDTGAGEYHNYRFKMDGFVQDEDTFKHCATLYEMFKEMGVKVQGEEELQSDGKSEAVDDSDGPIEM